MKGYIFVSPRSDPGMGRRLDDPIFGEIPTMGACRPDLRRWVQKGDHIFVVSGSTKGVSQYIIGEFEVDKKLDHLAAFSQLPERRLRMENGEKVGNVIVDSSGQHHPLDHHDRFEKRIKNYLVGRNPISLEKPAEVALARERTVDILREVFDVNKAARVSDVIGRNKRLDERQIAQMIQALNLIKHDASDVQTR